MVLAVALLSGCETFRVMNDYETAESPGVADAPWPRLVDVPAAPPPGSYTAAVPDPTTGEAVRAALAERTRRAEGRRAAAGAAALDEADRDRLDRRGTRPQGGS